MGGRKTLFRACFGCMSTSVKHEVDMAPRSMTKKTETDTGEMRESTVDSPREKTTRAASWKEFCERLPKVEEKGQLQPQTPKNTPVKAPDSTSSGSAFEGGTGTSSTSSNAEIDEVEDGVTPPAKTTTQPAFDLGDAEARVGDGFTVKHRGGRMNNSDVTDEASMALLAEREAVAEKAHPSRADALSCHPVLMRQCSWVLSSASDEESMEDTASDYE